MEMRSNTQRGFSIVEVMIAAAIFLVVALGILPIFAQAIRNNLAGRDATDVSNLGKSKVEEMMQVPFDSLVVPNGQQWACTAEYWSLSEKKWKSTAAPTAPTECSTSKVDLTGISALWVRVAQIRQFSLSDIQKSGTAAPLVGGTAAGLVQIKEIVVEVRSTNKNPLGSGKSLTLRMLRAV
ncbi:MAG TPA: prepilin-type N-terminal cleavage/methylation domain-containing protein [Thermoanaerobaculia bacterium]|jgi:prepilin-type N-terminal cleavage/methylation domain-containing protein|nr:prepilin-type N-terminal cleavage/methylation domain-containing protein [Thermoanaerobaculia bacterium]